MTDLRAFIEKTRCLDLTGFILESEPILPSANEYLSKCVMDMQLPQDKTHYLGMRMTGSMDAHGEKWEQETFDQISCTLHSLRFAILHDHDPQKLSRVITTVEFLQDKWDWQIIFRAYDVMH